MAEAATMGVVQAAMAMAAAATVAVAVAMAALAAGTAAVVAAAAAATTNWIGGHDELDRRPPRRTGSRWWIFRIGILDPWGGRRHLGVRDTWPWL